MNLASDVVGTIASYVGTTAQKVATISAVSVTWFDGIHKVRDSLKHGIEFNNRIESLDRERSIIELDHQVECSACSFLTCRVFCCSCKRLIEDEYEDPTECCGVPFTCAQCAFLEICPDCQEFKTLSRRCFCRYICDACNDKAELICYGCSQQTDYKYCRNCVQFWCSGYCKNCKEFLCSNCIDDGDKRCACKDQGDLKQYVWDPVTEHFIEIGCSSRSRLIQTRLHWKSPFKLSYRLPVGRAYRIFNKNVKC